MRAVLQTMGSLKASTATGVFLFTFLPECCDVFTFPVDHKLSHCFANI